MDTSLSENNTLADLMRCVRDLVDSGYLCAMLNGTLEHIMETDETAVGLPMPRYKCHKEVRALKIAGMAPGIEGDAMILDDQGYARFHVRADYVRKHNPQVGGYYVVYDDGYESFSPADAFESGYTLIDKP